MSTVGVMGKIDIITGTLGKALGALQAGLPAAERSDRYAETARSRPYLFSSTVAPALLALLWQCLICLVKQRRFVIA